MSVQMTMRKTYFIFFILFASITCSGCFTMKWNAVIEDKITPRLATKTFSPKPDSFGVEDNFRYHEYKRCDYIGIQTIDGFRYHHSICPNMYNNHENAFLKLFIPEAKAGDPGKALIESISLPYKRTNNHDMVYIRFLTSGNATADPSVIRDYVDRSLRNTPFSTHFPSMMTLKLDKGDGKISLWFAQRLAKGSHTQEDLIRFSSQDEHHYGASCWPYQMRKYDYGASSADCELWYLSDEIAPSGTIDEANSKTLWKAARAMGYIITVPADIITSPLQLIGFAVMFANKPH